MQRKRGMLVAALSVLGGIAVLLFNLLILLCTVGFILDSEHYEDNVAIPIVQCLIILLSLWLFGVAIRLILGKERPEGGLLSPLAIYIGGVAMILLGAFGVFNTVQEDELDVFRLNRLYDGFVIGIGLIGLAFFRSQKRKMLRQKKVQDESVTSGRSS